MPVRGRGCTKKNHRHAYISETIDVELFFFLNHFLRDTKRERDREKNMVGWRREGALGFKAIVIICTFTLLTPPVKPIQPRNCSKKEAP
jgi:hypothetical protein